MATQATSPVRLRFSLGTLLVITVIAATAVCLFVSGTKYRRHQRLTDEIVGNLQLISQGIKLSADHEHTKLGKELGCLPPPVIADASGEALYSWRLPVGVCISSPLTAPDWDAVWNATSNRPLASWPYFVFCWRIGPAAQRPITKVWAVTGPGTAFDFSRRIAVADVPRNLILVMEAADSDINWMEPGDYDVVRLLDCRRQLGDCVAGAMPEMVHVLFADGEIWRLRGDTPMDRIHPFLLSAAAKKHSRENELGPYRLRKWSGVRLAGDDESP